MKKKFILSLMIGLLILVLSADSYARTRKRSNYSYDNPTFFTSVNAGFFIPTGSTDNGGGLDDGFTFGINSFVPMKIPNVKMKLPEMALGLSVFYSHARFLKDNDNDGESSYSLLQIVPSVRAINPFGVISPVTTTFVQAGFGIFRTSVDGSDLLDLTTNDIGVTLGGGASINRFEYMGNLSYIINDNDENMFFSLTIGYKFF